MRELLTTFGIGLVSGVLSGAFGIGGGIITTPGIRLLLGAPALIAVGTPLPVIFPSAITGALNYHRRGMLDVRIAVWCGAIGSLFAVLGAVATRWAGGTVVLLATAALLLYTAADVILQVISPPGREAPELVAAEERDAFGPEDQLPEETGEPTESRGGVLAASAAEPAESLAGLPCSDILGSQPPADSLRNCARHPRHAPPPAPQRTPLWKLALIGGLTGAYSGFLGLGGGFVLVPLLTRWLGFGIKRAIGTSLAAIAILAVPGTITHALLGHVDWRIAFVLALGVVPGALLGSRITLGSSDRVVRIAFAAMLVIVGAWLAAAELGWLPR